MVQWTGPHSYFVGQLISSTTVLDPPLHLPIVSAPINGQPKKGQKKKPPLPAHNNSLWSVVGAGVTSTSSRPLS